MSLSTFYLCIICSLLIAQVFSFLPSARFSHNLKIQQSSTIFSSKTQSNTVNRSFKKFMSAENDSNEDDDADFITPNAADSEGNLFDMNRRVRLGRSRDQDGKSNIWSIEPRMEVQDENEEGNNSNLFVGLGVIGAAILALPLFSAFSQLIPDPSDF